jgi:hydrogenase expression/formation protein HypD
MPERSLQPEAVHAAMEYIRNASARPARFMEVCGTHTVAVFRSGLRNTLLAEKGVELVSGPGCPVCVTSAKEIDEVARLAIECKESVTVAAYGDMFRAKGHELSLADARAFGADVRMVTSPFENIRLAQEKPQRKIVFFAIGFETTQPGHAHTLIEARRLGLPNLTFYVSHKLIAPALHLLAEHPALRLDGFILPGHVSAIIGEEPYRFLAEEYRLPGVIAGFEPGDIVVAIARLLAQRAAGESRIENAYRSTVRPEGNPRAQELISEVFETADAHWRGIGLIPASGHALRSGFAAFDAHQRFGLERVLNDEAGFGGCRCGEVLLGLIAPTDCAPFGEQCTPDSPLGPCMVSSEGACANYYRFGERR